MATIGTLAVNVVAKTSQLTKGIASARKSLNRFAQGIGRTIARVGGLTAALGSAALGGGFAFLIKQQFSLLDTLGKTSEKLGLTTQALAGLRHAAQLTGVETRTFDLGLQRMVRRIQEAAIGTGEAQGALIDLGLSAERLGRLSPDQQFSAIAEAMQKVTNQGERVRLSFKLFDSEGVALVNTLALGADGLREAADEAARLGLAVDDKAVNSIERANNAIIVMRRAFQGVFTTLSIHLAPAVKTVADATTDWITDSGRGVKSLQRTVDGLAASFLAIADAVHDINILFKQSQGFAIKGFRDAVSLLDVPLRDTREKFQRLLKFTGLDVLVDKNSPLFQDSTVKNHLDNLGRSIEAFDKEILSLLIAKKPSEVFAARVKSISDELKKNFDNTERATDGLRSFGDALEVATQSAALRPLSPAFHRDLNQSLIRAGLNTTTGSPGSQLRLPALERGTAAAFSAARTKTDTNELRKIELNTQITAEELQDLNKAIEAKALPLGPSDIA